VCAPDRPPRLPSNGRVETVTKSSVLFPFLAVVFRPFSVGRITGGTPVFRLVKVVLHDRQNGVLDVAAVEGFRVGLDLLIEPRGNAQQALDRGPSILGQNGQVILLFGSRIQGSRLSLSADNAEQTLYRQIQPRARLLSRASNARGLVPWGVPGTSFFQDSHASWSALAGCNSSRHCFSKNRPKPTQTHARNHHERG
jgi:hypothetical protein